jgi:hypothetical protein
MPIQAQAGLTTSDAEQQQPFERTSQAAPALVDAANSATPLRNPPPGPRPHLLSVIPTRSAKRGAGDLRFLSKMAP